jgi:hypothetical protein
MKGQVSFGDNVRIAESPETAQAGISGRLGCVYGVTTPSVTNVEVIGELRADCAINVHVEELNESFWLASELVEFVDHSPGSEVWIQGAPAKSVRQADGSWREVPIDSPPPGRLRRLLNRLLGE